VAANLKGRLARIRKLGPVKAGVSADRRGAAIGPDRPSFLAGWDRLGEMAWSRTLRYPNSLPGSLDPAVFAPLRRTRGRVPPSARGAEARVEARIDAARLRLFDLETTGLSGGTGTVAFLAAVGRVAEGEFELTQVFLEDYPGEPAFLARLLPLLAGDAAIVSYNGKAFDMPLLRTRCVMNGLPPPEPALHIDALFASRRLWRRVHGGASLGLLEREVLGIEREADLPGAMIPEAWLAFARDSGREAGHPLMPLVLSHNADDVVGLARLVARVQDVFDDPRPQAGLDRFGLGRTLISAGRDGEGEELLEAALGDGDEGAGLVLSMRYRRAARVEDCLRVAGTLPATYRCAVERAKLFERLAGDPGEAMRWAKEALMLASTQAEREAAGRRLARLSRKASGGK
jgi:uncharacterized protein